MLSLIMADIHKRASAPVSRRDDFCAAQKQKINEIVRIADERMVHSILFPGDIFDSYSTPDHLKEYYIRVWASLEHCDKIAVFGQHDMRYHSSARANTPLGVLAAGVPNFYLLEEGQPLVRRRGNETVVFYGSSYGDDSVPTVVHGYGEDARHVWITHRMVVKDKLWEDQEDFYYGDQLLDELHEFDMIATGDNHKQFVVRKRMDVEGKEIYYRNLINTGSLMRSTISQIDHKPAVYLWDSESGSVERIPLTVRPAEEVFDLAKVETERQRDEKMETFVNGLKDTVDVSLDFKDNVRAYCIKNKVDDGVIGVINEVLSDA